MSLQVIKTQPKKILHIPHIYYKFLKCYFLDLTSFGRNHGFNVFWQKYFDPNNVLFNLCLKKGHTFIATATFIMQPNKHTHNTHTYILHTHTNHHTCTPPHTHTQAQTRFTIPTHFLHCIHLTSEQ